MFNSVCWISKIRVRQNSWINFFVIGVLKFKPRIKVHTNENSLYTYTICIRRWKKSVCYRLCLKFTFTTPTWIDNIRKYNKYMHIHAWSFQIWRLFLRLHTILIMIFFVNYSRYITSISLSISCAHRSIIHILTIHYLFSRRRITSDYRPLWRASSDVCNHLGCKSSVPFSISSDFFMTMSNLDCTLEGVIEKKSAEIRKKNNKRVSLTRH